MGGYLGGGIHYKIAPKIFVGIEGKYLWTEEAKFTSVVNFKLDGIISTAVIGFRF